MADLTTESEEFKPLDVIGNTGLKQFSGIIDEEFMIRLRGPNAIRLYREMIDNSSTIATALNAIKWLIRQVEWRVEPADESDAAIAEAEDTEGALEDMSHTWGDFIDEALSMIWAGYAPFEIVYKLRRGPDQEDGGLRSKFNDGKFGWRKVEIRAQESLDRWVFAEDDGGLDGMVQMVLYGEQAKGPVFIPVEKMLLFRIERFKNNPEGKSLIRPAVVPYFFTKRIQEFEAIGVERNLAGMPVMEVPAEILVADASPAARSIRQQMEKFITQVRMDERYGGLVPSETKADGTPSGFKFKLMQGGGTGKVMDTDTIIKRYRNDILRIFMAHFLALGSDGVGSFSLATSQTDLFGTALNTIMDSISDVVNRFMIPRRQRLNNRPQELDPVLVHGEIQGPELEKVAAYIAALSTAGAITPHPALERKLMEIGGLPQPPDDEDEGIEPLSENTIDNVNRTSMSSEQVTVVLDVNKALRNKALDRDAAIATIGAALGLTAEAAARFVPAEKDESELPQPPPIPPQPGQPPMDGPEDGDDDANQSGGPDDPQPDGDADDDDDDNQED